METIAQKIKSKSTTKQGGVTDSVSIAELPILANVRVDEERVYFDLEDGRIIAWPWSWSELLTKATPEQRQNFTHSAYHVFWDELDEIIGVKNVLYPVQLQQPNSPAFDKK
jgi:hypothetical protein